MLPNDINMLVSFLNTKLRDDDMSLEHLLEINDINLNEFMTRLDRNGYFFDENTVSIETSSLLGFSKKLFPNFKSSQAVIIPAIIPINNMNFFLIK